MISSRHSTRSYRPTCAARNAVDRAWLDQKPYREVYDGAIYQKTGGLRRHSLVSGRMCNLLYAWGASIGDALTEQRVYLAPGVTLVPDVAYFSDKRTAQLSDAERETPPLAPDMAVEIRSPDDRAARITRKTGLYLQYGSTLVINVDPDRRTVVIDSPQGRATLRPGDVLQHPAFPGLRIAVDDIFAPLDRKRS